MLIVGARVKVMLIKNLEFYVIRLLAQIGSSSVICFNSSVDYVSCL